MNELIRYVFIPITLFCILFFMGSLHSLYSGLLLSIGSFFILFSVLFLRVRYLKRNQESFYLKCITCSDFDIEEFGKPIKNTKLKINCRCGAKYLVTESGIERLDNNSGQLFKRINARLVKTE